MENSKHTPGPWEWEIKNNSKARISRLDYGFAEVFINPEADDTNELEANAKLIAEAGTVATECGLTPRQLLDQRNELLEALKELLACAEYDNAGEYEIDCFFKAKQAIQKAQS